MTAPSRLCIIGLGYVGLPLAVALARHFPVIGLDANPRRVAELQSGVDRNLEVKAESLRIDTLRVTAEAAQAAGCDVYIITVPTPVDSNNKPDLTAVRAACATVGRLLTSGAIVVLESTVYPGVTEEVCGPALEAASGLVCGKDFFLGYSPERINPGDREHTVERITKVVAGQTPEVAQRLAHIYGAINEGKVFVARSIKTAEAAKVIENAQRDINIAFINEVTVIFNKLGLSIFDVLDAARTKWNFLPFTPGLVGGHCIGVDPYYLADCAHRLGHNPAVILAGRQINDDMSAYLAREIAGLLEPGGAQPARILVLGLTFKENVPDLRNSKVADLCRTLAQTGARIDIHDPLADADDARHEFGLDLLGTLDGAAGYDCVVGAVPHREYLALTARDFERLLKPGGMVADIKGMWRSLELPATLRRWQV